MQHRLLGESEQASDSLLLRLARQSLVFLGYAKPFVEHLSVQLDEQDEQMLHPGTVCKTPGSYATIAPYYLSSQYIVSLSESEPSNALYVRCVQRSYADHLLVPEENRNTFKSNGITLWKTPQKNLELIVDESAMGTLRENGKFVYASDKGSIRIETESHRIADTSEWRIAA